MPDPSFMRGELVVTPPESESESESGVTEHSTAVSHLKEELDEVVELPFPAGVRANLTKRQIIALMEIASNKTGKDMFELLTEAGLR